MVIFDKDLEDVIDLSDIRLFLNSFDIVHAFTNVLDRSKIKNFAKKHSSSKPYFGLAKDTDLSSKKEIVALMNTVSSINENTGEEAKNMIDGMQASVDSYLNHLYIDAMVAFPLLCINTSNKSFNVKNNKLGIKYVKKNYNHIHSTITGGLNLFFQKACDDFKDLNDLNYDEIKSLMKKPEYKEGLAESKNNSSIALYLMGHDDPKIKHFAFHFVERDVNNILESCSYFWRESMMRIPGKGDASKECEEEVAKTIDCGNLFLKNSDLTKENDFLPYDEIREYHSFCIERFYKTIFDRSQAHIEGLITEKSKQSKKIEKLEEKVRILEEKNSNSSNGSAEEEKPSVNNGIDSKKYQDALDRIKCQREKIELNKSIISEKQEEIREKDQIIAKLESELSKYEIEPVLKKIYENESCLVVVENEKQERQYSDVASEVFGLVDVIKEIGEVNTNPSDYDVVLFAKNKSAKENLWLINFSGTEIEYVGEPRNLKKFIFDNFVPGSYK